MKKEVFIFLLISFVIGFSLGIFMIEDIQTDFVVSILALYLLFLVVGIIFVNMRFERLGLSIYLYPLMALIMYIPVNVLAGLNLDSAYGNYYSSFPRYEIIPYYILFLLGLYLIARMIDYFLKSKHSKVLFTITDILSLTALPLLLVATYFVSPH